MFFIYNLFLYSVVIVCLPLILVLLVFNGFRFRERLGLRGPDVIDSRKSIWLHGASMGEIGIIKKILPDLKKKYPAHPIVVSATTPSGLASIRRDAADLISHALLLPLELPFAMRRIVRLVNPEKLVIAETELWPNLIAESKRYGARVVLINGRVSDRSFPKYLFFNFFFGRVLSRFDAMGVQTREYYRRFQRLGANRSRMAVTGNIKGSIRLRSVEPGVKDRMREALGVPAGERIWIAASTHAGEEETVVRVHRNLRKAGLPVFLILAPRYPKRTPEIEEWLRREGVAFRRKSGAGNGAKSAPVLILDTFGELSDLFTVADVAFVGGTLIPHGGHNLLEPFPTLTPVCFGPHFDTQKESARIILSNRCGASVRDGEELEAFLTRALTDQEFYNGMVAQIRSLLEKTDIKLKANLDLI
jgi:3-deoxy-D-manno-octulosonic-acid transferase